MSGRLQFCDPVRIVVVNKELYRNRIMAVVRQLHSDGMCLIIDIFDKPESPTLLF